MIGLIILHLFPHSSVSSITHPEVVTSHDGSNWEITIQTLNAITLIDPSPVRSCYPITVA